jgi:hypothetical protein
MKKQLMCVLSVLLVLGCSTMVNAYSYSGDIVSGSISLDVTDEYLSASLTTLEAKPLVVDFVFDPAPSGGVMSYTASATLFLKLLGFIPFSFNLPDMALGAFAAPDLSNLLGDGVAPANHVGSRQITAAFGGYSLTGATLEYDYTFTPDEGTSDRYAIAIDDLTLSGGNTSQVLTDIVDGINASGIVPGSEPLNAPFTIPVSVSGGTFDIQAAAPVPVPAAIWLLASGLLGLVGIRRKAKL